MISLLNNFAQGVSIPKPNNCTGPNCQTNLPEVPLNAGNLKLLLGIVFGVAAGVALITLVIAAVNFASAATDFEKVARSKKAILYSLLGFVIAMSAEAIVLTLVGKI